MIGTSVMKELKARSSLVNQGQDFDICAGKLKSNQLIRFPWKVLFHYFYYFTITLFYYFTIIILFSYYNIFYYRKSPSNPDAPQFPRTPNQSSITDFTHVPKENTGNIIGELTPAKFRNLTLTKLGNDVKIIVQNEIKEHLNDETPKSDQSVTNSYLKEINILKEEMNKKEVLIKDLVETIKNLRKNSLKQQPI